MSVERNRGIEKYQQVPPGQQGKHGEKGIPPPKRKGYDDSRLIPGLDQEVVRGIVLKGGLKDDRITIPEIVPEKEGFDPVTTRKLEMIEEMYRDNSLPRGFRLKLSPIMDALREGEPVNLDEIFAKKKPPKAKKVDPFVTLEKILSMKGEKDSAGTTTGGEVNPPEAKAIGVVPEGQPIVVEEIPLSPKEREERKVGEIVSAINEIRDSVREGDKVKVFQLSQEFGGKFARERIGVSNFDEIRHTNEKPIFKALSDGHFWMIPLGEDRDTYAVIIYPTSAYIDNYHRFGGNELFDVQAVEGKKSLTGKDLTHRNFSSDQWELVKPAIVRRSGQELEVLQRGELNLGEIES